MLLSLIVCLAMLPLQGEFPICEAPGLQGAGRIEWDGTNYLVAWMDCRTDTANVWGRIVTPEGSFIDTNFAISIEGEVYWWPDLAWSGTNFLVVWEDWRNGPPSTWGQFVSADGHLIDTNFVIASGFEDNYTSAVAWGVSYLVVWSKGFVDQWDVWGQFIANNGSFIDTAFAICTAPNEQGVPQVEWNGTNYLVAWGDSRFGYNSRKIWGILLSQDGLPVGEEFIISFSIPDSTDPSFPNMEWSGVNALVVWDLGQNGNFDIWGQLVDTSGALIDSNFPISTAVDYQDYPRVAWGGTYYLVVWRDQRNGTGETWGQFVAEDGALIDTNFFISSGAGCDVAYDGNRFLVVYSKNIDIWGKFIEPPPGIEETPIGQYRSVSLQQNFPNPFSITTSITFTLPSIGHSAESEEQSEKNIELNIYDVSGRLVRTLVDGVQRPGVYQIEWDGLDERGKTVPPGVYFAKLCVAKTIKVRKMIKLNSGR